MDMSPTSKTNIKKVVFFSSGADAAGEPVTRAFREALTMG